MQLGDPGHRGNLSFHLRRTTLSGTFSRARYTNFRYSDDILEPSAVPTKPSDDEMKLIFALYFLYHHGSNLAGSSTHVPVHMDASPQVMKTPLTAGYCKRES